MDQVTSLEVGANGEVVIPGELLEALGLAPATRYLLEKRPDGSLGLRPDPRYEIELYTDERIREFDEEGRMSEAERERVEALLARLARP